MKRADLVRHLERYGCALLREGASFEGESEEARLARRQRNWIANVEYVESSA